MLHQPICLSLCVANVNFPKKIDVQRAVLIKKNGLHCVAACGNCRNDGWQDENSKNRNSDEFSDERDDRNIFDILSDLS